MRLLVLIFVAATSAGCFCGACQNYTDSGGPVRKGRYVSAGSRTTQPVAQEYEMSYFEGEPATPTGSQVLPASGSTGIDRAVRP